MKVIERGVIRAEQARRGAVADENRQAIAAVRDDPAMFARTIVYAFNAWRVMNAIDELEPDEGLAKDRKTTLYWVQSGLNVKEFARRLGIWETTVRRSLGRYCEAVAERLNAANAPVTYKSHDIVFGLCNIAAALGKTEKKTLKLIETGKLPVGKVGGELCASLTLLAPYQSRQRKPKSELTRLASAAFIPQSSNRAALSLH
jgi:hypothetical protein